MRSIVSVTVPLVEVIVAAGEWGAGVGEVEGPATDGWPDTGEDACVRKV